MKAPLHAPKRAVEQPANATARAKAASLVDNRASTIKARSMQEAIYNSPQQIALRQKEELISSSPIRRLAVAQQLPANRPQQHAPASLQKKVNKTGLPDKLKAGVENLSGHSLDDVKVHYDSAKPAQLQAHAYAQGTEIHLGPGQEKHLPHEAWHVVQQKQGRVRPTTQLKGVGVNADSALEKEADVMGARAKSSRLEPVLSYLTPAAVQPVAQLMPFKKDDKVLYNGKIAEVVEIIDDNKLKIIISGEKVARQVQARHVKAIGEPTNTPSITAPAKDSLKDDSSSSQSIAEPPKKQARSRVKESKEEEESKQQEESKEQKENKKQEESKEQEDVPEMFMSSIISGSFAFESKLSGQKAHETVDATLAYWKGIKAKDFYNKVRSLLKEARDPKNKENANSIKILDNLILNWKEKAINTLIKDYVREKAKKASGASSGTGFDELFQTAETMKYLELSYKGHEGKQTTAIFNGAEFDWMDAQEKIRLSTELIIWSLKATGKVISGHTGTFQKKYRGVWMTINQNTIHAIRDKSISSRSNPATAIMEAIGIHLKLTANAEDFASDVYYESPSSKEALLPNGISLYDSYKSVANRLAENRDMLKNFYNFFQKKLKPKNSAISSPVAKKTATGYDYKPSPSSNNNSSMPSLSPRQIGDNPLPTMGSYMRPKYDGTPIPILLFPISKNVEEARKQIKIVLPNTSKKIIANINKAKRGATKKGLNKDYLTIESLIKSLKDPNLNPLKKLSSNLVDLESELKTLTRQVESE